MPPDPLLEQLERTLADSYKREIEAEENVWRSLPFFAATLALQFAGLAQARDWLLAQPQPNQSDWALRLSVNCQHAESDDWRSRFARQPSPILITQGFIAGPPQGGTAILGRGGSDTSAATFGALLQARQVEIWTDVPGMFSANPREVPEARLLKRLDYAEAQEIATTGAKVLHPRAIPPLSLIHI